jgi:hypothetical protein
MRCIDARAGLDVRDKRKVPCPCQYSNREFSAFQPIAYSIYGLISIKTYIKL